jgi:hypothetical protein
LSVGGCLPYFTKAVLSSDDALSKTTASCSASLCYLQPGLLPPPPTHTNKHIRHPRTPPPRPHLSCQQDVLACLWHGTICG